MKRKLVYVAGKYTAPTPEEEMANIIYAKEWGHRVEALGGAVAFVPHIGILQPAGSGLQAWNEAMAKCLPILGRCDAIFLTPGGENSRGSILEHTFATEEGIPIFHSLETLDAFLKAS